MCGYKKYGMANKSGIANKRTGKARKNKSLKLMQDVVDELKALQTKP